MYCVVRGINSVPVPVVIGNGTRNARLQGYLYAMLALHSCEMTCEVHPVDQTEVDLVDRGSCRGTLMLVVLSYWMAQ